MNLTLTVTGPASQLRLLLERWEEIINPVESFALSEFVANLTADGRQAVETIAEASVDGRRVYQDELAEKLGTHEDNELYGVMGGVGRNWARLTRDTNPFMRKWDATQRAGFYEIDSQLAGGLLDAIQALGKVAIRIVHSDGSAMTVTPTGVVQEPAGPRAPE